MILPRVHGCAGRRRADIVAALAAEGLPAMAGYEVPLSSQPAFAHLIDAYPERFRVMPSPVCERICARSVWLPQELLLGDEEDMADAATIFRKVQALLAA